MTRAEVEDGEFSKFDFVQTPRTSLSAAVNAIPISAEGKFKPSVSVR